MIMIGWVLVILLFVLGMIGAVYPCAARCFGDLCRFFLSRGLDYRILCRSFPWGIHPWCGFAESG
jgi:hypothetical protein